MGSLKGLDGHQAPSTSIWGGFYMTYIRKDFYGEKMGELDVNNISLEMQQDFRESFQHICLYQD